MAIYLDNAATSFPKPEQVYQAMDNYLRQIGASSGRGAYSRALEADQMVFSTRNALAKLFSIKNPSRIVFCSNATEAINLALYGLVKSGDNIITSSIEHNAVWRCVRGLEAEGSITITRIPNKNDGSLDLPRLPSLIKPNTRLIALTHASNVTGTIMPLKEVGETARKHGVTFLVDAAQTAGEIPIDIEELGIDLLAFTGHKSLLGPQGTGGLYIREGIDLQPLKRGGTGSESYLEHQPDTLPERFEAGTLNVAGIVGLGAAIEFLLQQGVGQIQKKKQDLTAYALKKLSNIPDIIIYGPGDPAKQVGVISINLGDIRPEELAHVLDEVYEIMVRAGLHCSPCAHRTIGTLDRGALRISLGFFNTTGDIDCLTEALKHIAADL